MQRSETIAYKTVQALMFAVRGEELILVFYYTDLKNLLSKFMLFDVCEMVCRYLILKSKCALQLCNFLQHGIEFSLMYRVKCYFMSFAYLSK